MPKSPPPPQAEPWPTGLLPAAPGPGHAGGPAPPGAGHPQGLPGPARAVRAAVHRLPQATRDGRVRAFWDKTGGWLLSAAVVRNLWT